MTTATKQAHTPGPWHVEVWDYSHASPPRKELNVQNGSNLLATVAWDEGKENPYTVQTAEAQANARLIAAAPEPLEALREAKKLMEANGWAGHAPNTIALMRAAIAKAEAHP